MYQSKVSEPQKEGVEGRVTGSTAVGVALVLCGGGGGGGGRQSVCG